MTIIFNPEGAGGDVSLAGDEDNIADGPLGLDLRTQTLLQKEDIVRADYPARFARGNRTYHANFTVRKKHEDYEAAHAYVIAHIQEFLLMGTVTFAQGAASLALTKAMVNAEGHAAGATSEWNYEVSGIKT